jgi:hypothetical protein
VDAKGVQHARTVKGTEIMRRSMTARLADPMNQEQKLDKLFAALNSTVSNSIAAVYRVPCFQGPLTVE